MPAQRVRTRCVRDTAAQRMGTCGEGATNSSYPHTHSHTNAELFEPCMPRSVRGIAACRGTRRCQEAP
eukprot:1226770-Alexandrium_andersonii.AAC.1